jgi:hypothetical protein
MMPTDMKGYKKVVLRTENLNTKAQKTALKILNKEELNSKKSRLDCLLVQQVQFNNNSRINLFIFSLCLFNN